MENEILENVLKDKDFLESVVKMDIKSAQDAFEKRGIKLTTNDMNTIKNLVSQKIENPESAPDEILEKVSGGRTTSEKIKNIAFAISSLVIASTVAGVGYKVYGTLEKFDDTVDKASGQSVVKTFFWGLPGKK